MPNFIIKDTSVSDVSDSFYIVSHESKSMENFQDELSILMKVINETHLEIMEEDLISDYDTVGKNFLTDIALLILQDKFKYSINTTIPISNLLDLETTPVNISGVEAILARKELELVKYTRYITKVLEKSQNMKLVLNRMK